ncbi:sodium/hydrogen exchanger 3-like [Limulus polyphemus]|uniref:Sodium/hydrogen exchanger n=1 Tax=Limulus polyphemus TaxID=6850 RepID=A0ABM1B381_LIMPO|nr:sodium/hydrogen exchanger 3-like [Limulus polyphemus]
MIPIMYRTYLMKPSIFTSVCLIFILLATLTVRADESKFHPATGSLDRHETVTGNSEQHLTTSRSDVPKVGSAGVPSLLGEPSEHLNKNHKSHRYHVATVDFSKVSTPYIISLWIFVAGLAKIGFYVTPKIGLICPESCVLVVVGVLIGLLLFFTGLEHVGPLTSEVFFLYMLPPIILDAGYFMPNRLFFDNMASILMYAVVGTVWNALTIGFSLWGVGLTGLYGMDMPLLDTLLFSSIVSAVDPVAVLAVFEEIHVNEVLYILVFGESLLNDAVTVVLYHIFDAYTEMGQEHIITIDYVFGVLSFFISSLGGAFVGVLWGLLASFLSRFTYRVLIIEPLFIFVFGYLSYLTSEIFHLSGIVALTFCGMTMKNYVEENISYKSHITLKYAMKMLANTSETIIFMFLGVSTVTDEHEWNTWFVVMTILFCSIYRSIGVVIQTWFLNYFRLHKVNKVEQFIMAYGGLRGAVAFALVLVVSEDHIPSKKMMVTTIIAVVYFTVFLQGMTIGPLVRFLRVPKSNKTKPTMNERVHTISIDHLMAGIEEIVGHLVGNRHLRDKFKYHNNKFIRPLLTRNHQVREPKIFETYSKLNLADAINLVSQNVNVRGKDPSISLASLIRTYIQNNLGNCSDEPIRHSDNVFSRDELNLLNLDISELDYSPTYKDLADAELHHNLSDLMFKPVKKTVRRYSRDLIDEDTPFHHKNRMELRHHQNQLQNVRARNKKKMKNDSKQNKNTLSRWNLLPGESERSDKDGASLNNSETIIHMENLDSSDKPAPSGAVTFTIEEQNHTTLSQDISDESGMSRNSFSSTPLSSRTITETTLPWKREEDCNDESCIRKQLEFPSWVENTEYNTYTSLSSNVLKRSNTDDDGNDPPDVFRLLQLKELHEKEKESSKNQRLETDDKFNNSKPHEEDFDVTAAGGGEVLQETTTRDTSENPLELRRPTPLKTNWKNHMSL